MTRDDVQAWLDRYLAAWRANEPEQIESLFTEGATYRYHPYGADALQGREAIVAGWLEEGDDPDAWDAHYEPFAVDRDRAVATGWSRYTATDDEPERTFHNVFLLRFAPDGRCEEFTELYMLERTP
ncbi:MAG TPA: nuclear transport factor 2 family protein [Candidatus Limnocylindria bacterium]